MKKAEEPIVQIANVLHEASNLGMIKVSNVKRPTDAIPLGAMVRNPYTKEEGKVVEKRWKSYGVRLNSREGIVWFEARFVELIPEEEND